jgi:tetratricopeptide (TPR) repeat protein
LGVSLAVSDPRAAANHFRRALSLRNDVPAAHLRLGELLLLLEEFDEASEHLQAAYRGDSHDPRTQYDIAQLLAARGDVAAALPWAESATRLAPHVKMVHELLANLHRRLGNHDAARVEMQLADQATIQILEWSDPFTAAVLALRQDVSSLLDRAQLLLDQGRFEDAIQVLRQALQGDDRNPTVHCMLARTLIQANHLPEARELLERAEQRHPQSAEVQFLLGTVTFMTQRYNEAERSFRAAVRLQPDYSLAYYNLGHTLLKIGDDESALEAFATAVKLRPDYADAHTNLAKLWLRRGNNEQAAEHLRYAVQLKPGDAEARRLLDQIRDGL